jgi:medium-chain acyl-[acyl-carrier-protein] hydrolase
MVRGKEKSHNERIIMNSGDILKQAKWASSDINVWREDYHIRSYEVDCRNRLSISTMFSFMQEAASKHAAALGVSIHQLRSENFTWLLSRLKIKIAAYPGWNDRIQVSTWPSGMQRLFALRDFEIKDAANRMIAAAISAWLVVDLQKRRPVRIAPFVERLKPIEGSHVLPDRLDKLAALKRYDYKRNFAVRYSDLDINQHVNNVSFVQWVVECVPPAVLTTAVPAEVEINFLAEAFYDDQILATCHSADTNNTEFLHSLTRRQDGRELARAMTKWQQVD